MDETALLCFGILMEEMANAVLGDTGDLALTEGASTEGEAVVPEDRNEGKGDVHDKDSDSMRVATLMGASTVATTRKKAASSGPRDSKRRKTNHHIVDGDTNPTHRPSTA